MPGQPAAFAQADSLSGTGFVLYSGMGFFSSLILICNYVCGFLVCRVGGYFGQ